MKPESRNKLIIAVLAVVGLVFFAWWGSFDSVNDILKDTARYRKEPVRLFGRVGPVYNVPFIGGLYKFKDTSGEMWVITDSDSTTKGKIMYIEATVRSSPTKKMMKLKSELEKILGRKIFEWSRIPSMLAEEERGGLFASLKAVRAKK